MTIEELYKRKKKFHKFSDYEMDFQLEEKNENVSNNHDDMLLGYLQRIEDVNLQTIENIKITANISTHPHKFDFLLKMLQSIDGQFDEIRIYLNNYREIPKQLEKYTCHIGRDLEDRGKFFWCNNTKEYYFTLNDDVIYPPDYVKKTIPVIGDRIVTYGGTNLYGRNQRYINNHRIYHVYKKKQTEVEVDVADTSAMAFNTTVFSPNLWKSPNKKVTDLIISLEAAMYGISLVSLKKEERWIKPIELYQNILKTEDQILDSVGKKEDGKSSSIADMILDYKQHISKINTDLLSISLNKSSVDNVYSKILEMISNTNDFSFYHLGCGDGNMIFQLSITSDFNNLVGVETVQERINSATKMLKKFRDIKYKIHFVNIEYDKLEFEENSVVFLNDYAISPQHTEKVWDKLNNNCYLISTKIINQFPIDKIDVLSDNNIKLTYYYYLKKCSVKKSTAKYQKTLIINLEDCQQSKVRFKKLSTKFNYFHNCSKFRATGGRKDDWSEYVIDRWNWGKFARTQSYLVNMSDGEIGCCMSHIRLWKKIVDENIESCLVIEDDAFRILPGFDLYLEHFIDKLPKDWDIFLVGFLLFRDKGEPFDEYFIKVKEFVLTHCYLITKHGAKKLLESLPADAPIDTFMSNCSDKVNIYSHNYFCERNSPMPLSCLIGQSSPGSLIENHTNRGI